MHSGTRLGAMLVALGALACAPGSDVGGDGEAERLEALEARIAGLESFLIRNTLPTAPSRAAFPDNLDCGAEETYAGEGTYTVNNRCEFPAYIVVYDSSGSFDRQERVPAGDSHSTTIGPGESVKVICTLVETVDNPRCTVTRQ